MALPLARMGVVLSASNRWVEPYFRAYAPDTLAVHVMRMRMAAQARAALDVATSESVAAARLVAEARVDVIDLQMTGLAMAMGAEAEAKLTAAIEDATGIPTYTATQALVEALRALGLKRVLSITPASGRERAYLEAAGITFADEVELNLGDGPATAEVPPETWVAAARANDSSHAQGILLSGSNTTMVDAIQPIEEALGKPVVTSVQAALWGGIRRVGDKLGPFSPSSALGRLMAAA
jgi:maleate cis-trans isomerase